MLLAASVGACNPSMVENLRVRGGPVALGGWNFSFLFDSWSDFSPQLFVVCPFSLFESSLSG